ncbi:MAG TPA: 5-formyltetrahydrofolate cyclo-ligase [Micropepsaceae bacterium]|nr:5-formyltetrahydrofolate cyclo-ligase [Micropepsaceae bacterium]
MPPSDLLRSAVPPAPSQKETIRRDMLRRAQSASAAYGEDAARQVAEILLPALSLPAGSAVAGYAPLKSEIDPTLLLERLHKANHRIALPVVEGDNVPLSFRLWRPGDKLVAGPFGTRTTSESQIIEPALVLVPLVAFDAKGHRLGRGGGYYDRTLTELRARGSVLAVGLAFDCQRHEDLPVEDHDEALDAVVTERQLYRFSLSPLLAGPASAPSPGGSTARRRTSTAR